MLIDKKNMFAAVAAGIAVLAAVFLLEFAWFGGKIAAKKAEWKKVETCLNECRILLSPSNKIDKAAVEAKAEELRRKLPRKSSMAAVLNELTDRGQELGIDFAVINPQDERADYLVSSGGMHYKVVPITVDMKATFKSMVEYADRIENLDSTFATIDNIRVSKDGRTYPKLNVKMTVFTYILGD